MTDLLLSGLELMLLGMGIVFVFLTLLVFTLNIMARLAARLHASEPQEEKYAKTVTDTGANHATHLAVISAAVARYRASHA